MLPAWAWPTCGQGCLVDSVMRDTPEEALLAPQSHCHRHHHLCHHQRASLITISTITSIITTDPYLTTVNIPMTPGQHSPSPLPTLFHHHHHYEPITIASIVLTTPAPFPPSSPVVTPITRSYTAATFIPIVTATNTYCHDYHHHCLPSTPPSTPPPPPSPWPSLHRLRLTSPWAHHLHPCPHHHLAHPLCIPEDVS